MTWADRLLGWIRASIQEYISPWSAEEKKKLAIQGLNASGTKENLARVWDSIPPSIQADPDVIAAHKQGVDSKLPDNATLAEQLTLLFGGTADAVTGMFFPQKGYTVEESFDEAKKFVALDFGKDLAVGLAGMAVETASVGTIKTFQQWFSHVRARTGYGGISTMVLKHPLELGLISPLSKALHAQYRDAYLRGQPALILATKGHISEEQMRKAFSYEGYPDWQIDAFVTDRWRELRLGEIAWALNDALIDSEWLDTKLKYALYSPEDRPVIIKMIQAKYLRTYRDRVATQIRNLYKEGYIDKAAFDSRLTQLEIPPKVIKMLASEADYLYKIDLNADLIATWTTAYKNDIISEDVLRGNLASIIVDPARVEAQVQKAAAARKPKSVAPAKPQTQGVRISSKPANASIFLDGSDTGTLTPETLIMSAGRHTILVSADGYEDAEYEVDLQAAQYVELYAVLVPLPEAAP